MDFFNLLHFCWAVIWVFHYGQRIFSSWTLQCPKDELPGALRIPLSTPWDQTQEVLESSSYITDSSLLKWPLLTLPRGCSGVKGERHQPVPRSGLCQVKNFILLTCLEESTGNLFCHCILAAGTNLILQPGKENSWSHSVRSKDSQDGNHTPRDKGSPPGLLHHLLKAPQRTGGLKGWFSN